MNLLKFLAPKEARQRAAENIEIANRLKAAIGHFQQEKEHTGWLTP